MRYEHQINHRIRANEVRLIGSDGENLGLLSKSDALKKAQEEELDLVVIAENANPPVAKILDYNKFLYDENKKSSAAKAKSKKSELKEFRFGPKIGEGDLNQRIERSREFIEDGNRVRITVRLKGREKAFPEKGFEKLEIFAKSLEDIARQEQEPKNNNGNIIVTFVRK